MDQLVDWLMSDTGTVAFCVGVIALYVGFVVGVVVNARFIEDDGGDWFDGTWDVPDSPDDLLSEEKVAH